MKNNDELDIFIYRHNVDAVLPKVQYNKTSSSFDITCIETVTLKPWESGFIKNGLSVIIPQESNYWMLIQARSSVAIKRKLIPHYGNIDAGYTGELGTYFYNFSNESVKIKKGERFAQISVIRKPNYNLNEISKEDYDKLCITQLRGKNGFGSTGK